MTNPEDLLTRLDVLNTPILKSRVTLKARYAYLKSKVDADIADLSVHRHHVNRLEKAPLEWLEGLNL